MKEGQSYYVRVFAVEGETTIMGDLETFISLGAQAPVIKRIDPVTALWNDTITIFGDGLGQRLVDYKVFFDEIPAQITGNTADGLSVVVPFKLVNKNAVPWEQVSSLPAEGRRYSASCSINGKGYVAGGLDSESKPLKDLWEYSPDTDSWLQKSDLPVPNVMKSVGMNDEAYFIFENKYFYKYYPISETWEMLSPLPESSSTIAMFVLNNNMGNINREYFRIFD